MLFAHMQLIIFSQYAQRFCQDGTDSEHHARVID